MKNFYQQVEEICIEICRKILYKKQYLFILAIIIWIYLILFLNIENIERKMTFPAAWKEMIHTIPLPENFEEINIQIADWNNINGIYLGDGIWKTVYYFHGNWVPLPYFYNEINYIYSLGYNVMAYDYPNYGKSTWIPSQKNIAQYSQIFFKDLQSKKQIKEEDVIVWWLSIWSAATVDFAARNNIDKVVLVAPMASRYDMASEMFWFPVQKLFFRKNTLNTSDTVKYFSQPALIIHWNSDQVIPFEQGKKVYKNYGSQNNTGNKKYFIELDNFWHNWIISTYGSALESTFIEFINSGVIKSDSDLIRITKENKWEWEEKTKKYNNVFKADLETDDSITKFVNSSVPFHDKAYIPENLQSFTSDHVADGKWYGTLRADLIPELHALWEAFYNEFGTKFLINSAYRSYAYQKWIKDRGCPDNVCAKAGYSEHQSWLGLDIFSISSESVWKNNPTLWKYYTWLDQNAHKYGFHNTYQKGLEIDGYEIEPWHWRYLWVDLATYLHEQKITIAEFYNSQKNNDE